MLGVILVMHENLGDIYLRCAATILEEMPPLTKAVRIDSKNRDYDAIQKSISSAIEAVDHGKGVLILTDLFGATPCNASVILEEKYKRRIKIISGLNFPMLLKVLTNRTLPLSEAAEAALAAGKKGIIDVIDTCCKKQIKNYGN